MNHENESWENLVNQWHQDDAELNRNLPTQTAVLKQISKHNSNRRLEAMVAGVVSVAVAGYLIFEMAAGLPSKADWVMYLMFLALVIGAGIVTQFYSQRANDTYTDSSDKYLTSLSKQVDIGLSAISFGRKLCISVMILSFVVLMVLGYRSIFGAPLESKHLLVCSIIIGCELLFFEIYKILNSKQSQLLREREFLNKSKVS